jgi:hypothetical protein
MIPAHLKIFAKHPLTFLFNHTLPPLLFKPSLFNLHNQNLTSVNLLKNLHTQREREGHGNQAVGISLHWPREPWEPVAEAALSVDAQVPKGSVWGRKQRGAGAGGQGGVLGHRDDMLRMRRIGREGRQAASGDTRGRRRRLEQQGTCLVLS